jgi:hypothetical protein
MTIHQGLAPRCGRLLLAGALLLLAACATAPSTAPRTATMPPPTDTRGVPGIQNAQLDPQYWIERQAQADRIVLDRAAIAAQNARLQQTDPSVRDIEALPASLEGSQVKQWIGNLSKRPTKTLYDEQGREVPSKTLDRLVKDLRLDAVPATQATRYGLVTRRADLRTFPTRLRVFSRQGDTDIDRFQESALFPGTPVVIAHESRDRKWWFVVSPLYAAWIEKDHVAEGGKQAVFDYTRKTPYLVVTGATARTVFTPEQPQVSDLQLDMGLRLPLLRDWPADKPVNGQHPYASHVVELPIRGKDGALQFSPALLPRTADVSGDYLPLNRANVLRQGFKFLGERYGWGHSYNARDCSGFVSEVYRSFGVTLPRNTSDQSVSPAFNRIAFSESDPPEKRRAAMRDLQVGDLIYIPGHVMMVIGHDNGMPYVIHDTNGGAWLDKDGRRVGGKLNGVSVTPLPVLMFTDDQTYIDRITNIQRIRP